MRKTLLLALFGVFVLASAAGAAEHRFGIGGHYWRAIDDLDVTNLEVEQEGVAPFLTYQWAPEGVLRLKLDLEYFEAGFGGATEAAVAPVAFVLVGCGFYGGVGVGVTLSDGIENNVSDPFYAARVGYDFAVLPHVHIDVNANYRANSFAALEDFESDSITLGAAVRVAFGDR